MISWLSLVFCVSLSIVFFCVWRVLGKWFIVYLLVLCMLRISGVGVLLFVSWVVSLLMFSCGVLGKVVWMSFLVFDYVILELLIWVYVVVMSMISRMIVIVIGIFIVGFFFGSVCGEWSESLLDWVLMLWCYFIGLGLFVLVWMKLFGLVCLGGCRFRVFEEIVLC